MAYHNSIRCFNYLKVIIGHLILSILSFIALKMTLLLDGMLGVIKRFMNEIHKFFFLSDENNDFF